MPPLPCGWSCRPNFPLSLAGGAAEESLAPPCRGSCRRLRGSRPVPNSQDRVDQLRFARQLRHNATEAEQLLWKHLRRKQLSGMRFRRQHPIGPYVADFACLKERLIIELDGGQHSDSSQYDSQRDVYLAERGFRVLRFWDYQVMEDMDSVSAAVTEAVEPGPPQPAAAPPARGSVGAGAAPPARGSVGVREAQPKRGRPG